MQEEVFRDLQIAYSGPSVVSGRMPMLALANGLRGQALLIERVSELLYGESLTLRVEVDASFESGSLLIPVHLIGTTFKTVEHVLTGEGFTALASLLAILGFLKVDRTNIYDLFKRLRGRLIEKPEDLPLKVQLELTMADLIRIYNDKEVQAQLRRSLEPLRENGIEEFQTRRSGVIISRVSKSDLQAVDEADLESITRDEEIDLAIEKSAWRRDLAWHFNDGKISFDAKIDDDSFWKDIKRGESFADGDRLRVHLKTTAKRTSKGKLKVERRIPSVISVEHVRRSTQNELYDKE